MSIPDGKPVVLFVSQSTTNPRKGIGLLAKAINNLSDSNFCVVTVGHHKPELDSAIPQIHLGYVQNERMLTLIYNVADVFVIPSFQDNLPNTVLEALSCGVPTVGFDVGGIPDMVRPHETGLLVPAKDQVGLGKAIKEILENEPARRSMSEKCRQLALSEYSYHVVAKKFEELYAYLIAQRRR